MLMTLRTEAGRYALLSARHNAPRGDQPALGLAVLLALVLQQLAPALGPGALFFEQLSVRFRRVVLRVAVRAIEPGVRTAQLARVVRLQAERDAALGVAAHLNYERGLNGECRAPHLSSLSALAMASSLPDAIDGRPKVLPLSPRDQRLVGEIEQRIGDGNQARVALLKRQISSPGFAQLRDD